MLRDETLREGTNVVIDSMLSNPDSAIALGELLVAAGYEAQVVDVGVPYELSQTCIAQRWRQSYEGAVLTGKGLGGRWVPSRYARDEPTNYEPPCAARSQIGCISVATATRSTLRFGHRADASAAVACHNPCGDVFSSRCGLYDAITKGESGMVVMLYVLLLAACAASSLFAHKRAQSALAKRLSTGSILALGISAITIFSDIIVGNPCGGSAIDILRAGNPGAPTPDDSVNLILQQCYEDSKVQVLVCAIVAIFAVALAICATITTRWHRTEASA